MKRFFASIAAAALLLAGIATSAGAKTDGHFPEGVSPGNACGAVSQTPAGDTGSANGFNNKASLFDDAC